MRDGSDEIAVGLVIVGVSCLYGALLGWLAPPPRRSRPSDRFEPGLTRFSVRSAENKTAGLYALRRWLAAVGVASLVAGVLVLVLR